MTPSRRTAGWVVGALVLATLTLSAQTLSDQVLALLARDNYWTGTNTYGRTVGLKLEQATLPLPTTTDRFENRGGNLWFNGVLVSTSAGAGTVTSVGLAAPGIFTVSGSPVVSTGTLTLALATQAANRVWAGPTTGADAAPTFRALVAADIPANPAIACTNCVSWASLNKSGSTLADLATRSASDLSSGTLPDARFPATLPALSGVNLTALNASNLASGTVPDARFPATLPVASGVNLTALNASNLASGTILAARMPALTGDITTSAGAVATTLATTAVTAASYGDATHVATFTVDTKGRLTAAASVAVTFPTVNLATGVGASILPAANGGSGLNGSAAANGRLLIGNGTGYTLAGLTGTASQITVTNGAGSITLALPQAIATASTPQWARVGLGTGAGATALLTGVGQYNLGLTADGNCGSALTANWNNGYAQTTTLNAVSCALTFTNPINGSVPYELILTQDGVGGRVVVWPAAVLWEGGVAPTLSTGAAAIDRCTFRWNGTNYLGSCTLGYA